MSTPLSSVNPDLAIIHTANMKLCVAFLNRHLWNGKLVNVIAYTTKMIFILVYSVLLLRAKNPFFIAKLST